MYLAPLNYDRFFKKVFSKEKVAKAFLEDFLDIKIDEIEVLNNRHFVTDKAVPVEFDYRCKLDNGKNIIIEMQQWYKTDVVKRFYLYHSLSASLQLETLEEQVISIDMETEKTIKDKVYDGLKPSITLIWMVDDSLGFKEDYIGFKMGVENLDDFIKNENIWNKSLKIIKEERMRVLALQNNNTKGLNFLSENKLIFAFQKNIVKNLKKDKKTDKYPKWFDFAKKTKSKKNKKSDFKDYKKDELFIDIMNMLLKDRLTQEEIKYITKEDQLKDAYIKYTSVILDKQKEVEQKEKELMILEKEKERIEKEKEKEIKSKEKAQKEKEKAQKEKEKAQKEKEKAQKEKEKAQKEKENILKASINKFLSMNLSVSDIAKTLGISEELVKSLKN